MASDNLSRLTDLEVRLYKLTTRSHLRVGAGEGTAEVATDNPIIRALILDEAGNDRRVPYIPGSSLHGVIRAWVEKVLRSGQAPLTGGALAAKVSQMADAAARENLLNQAKAEVNEFLGRPAAVEVTEDALYAHWQVYTAPHVCDPLSGVDKCERLPQQPDPTQPLPWKAAWWQTLEVAPPCAVCRIFGYMGQRGRVKFSHAWPTTEQLPLDVITRVAINRLTGAADEGKLFDLEAIPPGVDFHFFVVMENLSDDPDGHDDKSRFDLGIKALNMQLAGLGAHSTVGFGMVDIEPVFKASINSDIFSNDVEADFIRPNLANTAAAAGISLDLEKVPRFFRALTLAHAANNPLEGLITFT